MIYLNQRPSIRVSLPLAMDARRQATKQREIDPDGWRTIHVGEPGEEGKRDYIRINIDRGGRINAGGGGKI